MKNKKLLRVWSLVLCMMLLLAACGGGEASTTGQEDSGQNEQAQAGSGDDGAATDEEQRFVIGISQPFMGHPVRVAGKILIDAWAEQHPNVEIIVTDGELDSGKQIADIEDLMARNVDLIMVCAHQSPSLVNVLQDVQDEGIPLIAFDRPFTDTSVQIAEIYNDDVTAGKYAAELLVEGMGTEGEIVVLQGPAGNTTVAMRQEGFDSVIDNYPDIVTVSTQVADFQRVDAVDIFENVIQANPNISGVFCQNDEMALGVCKVLSDLGRDDVIVVGIDGQKDALESIIAGELFATVRKNLEFPAALDMAYAYLTTGSCEESVYLDGLKITIDNVYDFYDPDAIF